MPKDFIPEFITFSAKTSANQTQDLIDGKLDKRYGIAGVYPGQPEPGSRGSWKTFFIIIHVFNIIALQKVC